jgi:hypothetical protein
MMTEQARYCTCHAIGVLRLGCADRLAAPLGRHGAQAQGRACGDGIITGVEEEERPHTDH